MTPWLTLANRDLGTAEIKGARHNPKIMQYFIDIGATWAETDEVPWCAAFVGSCIERSGIRSSRSAAARDFLEWGAECDQQVGCIVVLKRGTNEKQGHVGFWLGAELNRVTILGGNQGNRVSVATFPATDVLGYRWPAQEAKPRVEALKRSWTVTGGLLALLGTLVNAASEAIAIATGALSEMTAFRPVSELLGHIGVDLPTAGIGIAVAGVIIVVHRRLDDAAKGKTA